VTLVRASRLARPSLRAWITTVVATAVAVLAADGALHSNFHVAPWRVAVVVAIALAAGAADMQVRYGSHGFTIEWGESALLFAFVLLPLAWIPFATTFGLCLGIATERRPVKKIVYNAAMWVLATTLAVFLRGLIDPHAGVMSPRGVLGLVVAATSFSLVTLVLSSTVVSIAQGISVRQILREAMVVTLLSTVGNQLIVIVILVLFRWSPGSIVLLPPVILASHLAYRSTLRARRERDAWRGLSSATQPVVGDAEMDVLQTAARRAIELFGAHHIEVIRAVPGVDVDDCVALSGDPATPPDRTVAPDHIEVEMHEAAGPVGRLRLCFMAKVVLSSEEQQSLQTFSHWLAGSLEQSRLMAESVRLADQMRELAERKAHEAAHDALTGLANRGTLLERGAAALEEAAAADSAIVALALIDLDHFKQVNDTLGHGAGDILLQEVARRLGDCAEEGALVARLGGDEFAILFTGLSTPNQVMNAVRGYACALGQPAEVDTYRLSVEGSIGVSCFPEDGATMRELLRCADVALYQAKSDPGGLARYDEQRDATSVDRVSLLPEIQTALACGDIRLHYQPKYDLMSGEAIGAEALARWWHPERGLLPPDLWVPVVEQSTLIREFTAYVLERAVADCVTWPRAERIAVNLSARCLLDNELPALVEGVLTRHGLTAERLTLEITETVMMSSVDTVEQTLAGLRRLGVRLSVDDFGTGYSSLTFLSRQTVDEVKIDRSFVATLTESQQSVAIVRSVIELAHSFGLDVVAEGIETADQERMLRAMGCDHAQGFLFSKPLPPEELLARLAQTDELEEEFGVPSQRATSAAAI
jgi:diguanylate cyclase (GGDEF)-like protein